MNIQQGVSLKDKNWFQTGGTAEHYAEVTSREEFMSAADFARENHYPVFVLGEGANILISDEGYRGLVVRPVPGESPEILQSKQESGYEYVECMAGFQFQKLIDFCLDNNLLGIEEFSGIPGTVGGSVYINIHYFEFLLSDFFVGGTVLDIESGDISFHEAGWFDFGYDTSKLQNSHYVLVDAKFRVKKTTDLETAYAKGRRDEIMRHRANRYPGSHTCGSFFRNFTESDDVYEKLPVVNGRKMIYVAYYLDKIGVKGSLQVGDAIVSSRHANMLVNQGNATSEDIINLAREMQQLVKDQFGFIPQPECQLIGFNEYPLLTS